MPRTYKKLNKRVTYDHKTLQIALLEIKRGNTLRDVSSRFNIPKSTLGKYKEVEDVTTVQVGGGRKTKLSKENEDSLAKYLYESGKYGYGLSKSELLQFVKEFCESTGIEWNGSGPGREWYEGFMRRHPELSVRKGEIMSSQRMRGADPYLINNWYEQLKILYEKENISPLDGHRVFNCDESGFSHDPKDVKLIAPKGQKRVSKNIAGSGKKNTTVLACGNACGEKLPPFIIFKGKYIWQNWIPDENEEYPGTVYAAQNKGWMEGDLFFKWFTEVFLTFMKPLEKRNNKKVILIYDGAGVHTSYKLSKAAVDNGVILVKLPPNATHYMQPLDKTVFKPIKTMWNKEMIAYNRKFPGKLLPNDEFSKKIKIIWEHAFKPDYLISGFRSTGLFPVNFTKFPEEAYDILKLKRYKASLPLEEANETTSFENPQPGPSQFEVFIRTKLTENLTKKSSNAKKRKRVTDNIGHVLTSKQALKMLKKKEKENIRSKKIGRKNEKRQSSSSSSDSEIIDVVLESELEGENLEISDEEVNF